MIFQTTDQIRQYLPANISLEVDTLKPYINAVEQQHLLSVLGAEQLDALLDYSNGVNTDEHLQPLLEKCLAPVLYLAIFTGFDLINVSFSDSGFRRNETDGSKSLYGYQERNIKEYLSTNGYNGLDNILTFLEANEADYPLWADSEACSLAYTNLIRNAAEFTAIYSPLRNSALIFRLLKSAITEVEDFEIKPLLGDDLYEMLLELVKDREINDVANLKYKKLLAEVNKPLAYLSIARGAHELGAKFTNRGLLFETVEPGADDVKAQAEAEKVARIVTNADRTGRGYLTTLRNYLIANATAFTEYVAPVDTSEYPDQTGKKVHTMF